MKNILISLTFFLFVSSCKKDSNSNSNTPLDLLTIDGVEEYIPSAYHNESQIVYINKDGTEKILGINFLPTEITEQSHNGNKYSSEKFGVTIFDESNSNFSIQLHGGANYNLHGSVVTSLSCFLMPFHQSGSAFVTIDFSQNEPIITPFSNYKDLINLNGIDFKNVFQNLEFDASSQLQSFSELYINKEFGVVAFRDNLNELWVFSKFKS